ncbi:hypothetical protein [Natronobacterium texcoconense]|uniref:Uncharacterized protein n=1 Tax=Natronobacterium texcoconense TaxID=1095778 RepID=A0A1H1HSF8_NATTX|nr:hypothetical protein [Natronobacterium texcoconense]SDR28342.1 hypothetical protein SAMN04489842_3007 [Natronobacterium texcoconense]
MSKLLTILATYSRIGAKAKRTIEHSPEFSGVQTSENGRPERQAPAGGFLTG